jgi:hypothetical protein
LHAGDLFGPKFAVGDFPTLTESAIFNAQGDEMNMGILMGKWHLAVLLFGAVILSGCGGGGGGSDSTAPPGATNKWASNSGTYVGCDGHQKITTIFSAVGADQATMTFRVDFYDADLCTGSIAGTMAFPSPLYTLTYLGTEAAVVSGIGVTEQTLSVDKVQLAMPTMTGTLSGPWVQGLCVNYSAGNECLQSLSTPAATMNTAIYLTATTLASLKPGGAGYIADRRVLTKQQG